MTERIPPFYLMGPRGRRRTKARMLAQRVKDLCDTSQADMDAVIYGLLAYDIKRWCRSEKRYRTLRTIVDTFLGGALRMDLESSRACRAALRALVPRLMAEQLEQSEARKAAAGGTR